MGVQLPPAKVILLAVHYASQAEIERLRPIASQFPHILRKELLLRILLTHLPETAQPSLYTHFVEQIANEDVLEDQQAPIDPTPIDLISDEKATKKVRKFSLLELSCPELPYGDQDDPLTGFLLRRAYQLDVEAGMLTQLPELLAPLLHRHTAVRVWMASTVLPLLRRNTQYYAPSDNLYSLMQFQKLPENTAVEYLLSETSRTDDEVELIGRDLRGLISPFLNDESRWGSADKTKNERSVGWQKLLEWLVQQATQSWQVAMHAFEQWDGLGDVDFAGYAVEVHLSKSRLQLANQNYVRAAMAAAYSISEPAEDALSGAYRIVNKAKFLLNQQLFPSLQVVAEDLPEISVGLSESLQGDYPTASYMRNGLLDDFNPLTSPSKAATNLLMALIISAFLLTRMGARCSIRKAAELALFRDRRDQKNELIKLLSLIGTNGAKSDDAYWERLRQEIIWLRNWGSASHPVGEDTPWGVFSMISHEEVEVELLKIMLSNGCYDIARSIYEGASEPPLTEKAVHDALYRSALAAFDNASNPNRTRGGLRKCNDILHALPKTVPQHHETSHQIEALLSAAHALSNYRLVLKQGEPFSPVVLRVHSDPISIVEKVLEQNKDAYTRLQEFLEMGNNLITASYLSQNRFKPEANGREGSAKAMFIAERRVISMCITSALHEDDFETAYSYVVNRLGSTVQSHFAVLDEWSWQAALRAGQYVRNAYTKQPTHLGTASGNPEIRHLEQRIECLATALRVAPANQLQEILKTFRRCEEQLDSAVQEEAAKETAWDDAADTHGLPGAFDSPLPDSAHPPRNMTASAAARRTEEAPMSLFDLSRATAQIAQRNLVSLSTLREMTQSETLGSTAEDVEEDGQRVRKRDQFREAATGTLVSGVGWLIGAHPSNNRTANS